MFLKLVCENFFEIEVDLYEFECLDELINGYYLYKYNILYQI